MYSRRNFVSPTIRSSHEIAGVLERSWHLPVLVIRSHHSDRVRGKLLKRIAKRHLSHNRFWLPGYTSILVHHEAGEFDLLQFQTCRKLLLTGVGCLWVYQDRIFGESFSCLHFRFTFRLKSGPRRRRGCCRVTTTNVSAQ